MISGVELVGDDPAQRDDRLPPAEAEQILQQRTTETAMADGRSGDPADQGAPIRTSPMADAGHRHDGQADQPAAGDHHHDLDHPG